MEVLPGCGRFGVWMIWPARPRACAAGCRGVGVAVVLTVAAACVIVPGAQALDVTTEIAVQANTGVLWTWTAAGAADTGLGMKRGTSPSVDAFGVGSDHLVVFQANTGDLWTTGSGGHGDSGLGMAAGTSPAVNRYGVIALQANTGDLWNIDPVPVALSNYGLPEGMAAGTSPSIDSYGGISFQASGGLLSGWPIDDGSNLTMAAGTSPSGNDEGYGAAQGSNGDLWTGVSDYTDQQLAMAAGTSPAVNDVGFVGDGLYRRGRVSGQQRRSVDHGIPWHRRRSPEDDAGYQPEHR